MGWIYLCNSLEKISQNVLKAEDRTNLFDKLRRIKQMQGKHTRYTERGAL